MITQEGICALMISRGYKQINTIPQDDNSVIVVMYSEKNDAYCHIHENGLIDRIKK